MKKRVEALKTEYGKMRTGQINISFLDGIKADYYGTPTAINQMASLSIPEPRTISIQPWEASMLKNIDRAIQKSDLDINPINDGKTIRLVMPVMTEERRKEVVKKVKKMGEEAKISIRNIRRDINDDAKKKEKAKEISEDECRGILEESQKETNFFVAEIDKIMHGKEKDIMEI